VNGHHAYSALVEGWSGPKCYIGTLFPWQSKGNLNNFPQWGPTVTNDALFIALEFGCNIVILAGVDLCFSPEGRTHTTGTPEGDLGPRLMQGDTFVTTNDGTVTETDHEYLRAADNINGMATLAHKRGQRVVNPSGQAVKLSQVEHISLADLETPESVLDAWSRICSLLPRHDREAQRHHCRVVERELLKATAEVRHIRGLAAEALECNRKLHGKEGKDPGSIQSVRIEKIERKIARHKVFEPFLKTFGLRQFYQTIRIDKDDEWSEQDKDEYAIGYYEAYTKTADVVLTILGFALKRLRTREEEIKEAPNMDLLLEYWGSDEARELNQDGQLAEAEKRIFLDVLTRSRFMHLRARPRAWQALRPDVVVRLSAANRVDLEALMAQQERRAEEFIQTLRNDLTKELALDKLGGRALEYFVNRDQDGLQRLQCGLGIHPHAEEAGQYLHLVEGYLAELAKEPEKAAGHYVEVHLPVIREAALKRRLYLLLGREELEESLTVLEELIRLSPFYLPHYADLLRITGKVQRAIDVFTGYLQNCPFDLYSMMKLGMLYYQIGANESAEWVMRHVLSRQPRNQVATEILERLTRAEEGPVDAGAAAS